MNLQRVRELVSEGPSQIFISYHDLIRYLKEDPKRPLQVELHVWPMRVDYDSYSPIQFVVDVKLDKRPLLVFSQSFDELQPALLTALDILNYKPQGKCPCIIYTLSLSM